MIKLLRGLLRGPVYDVTPEVKADLARVVYPPPAIIEGAAEATANYEIARIQDEYKDDRDQLPLPGMRDVSVELAALDLLFRQTQMHQVYIDYIAPHARRGSTNQQAYDRLRAFIMEHV